MNTLFKTITTAKSNHKRRASDKAANVVSFEESTPLKTQKLIVRDLELDMFVGVMDSEKKAKQRVIFNVECEVVPNENWQNDSFGDVISYTDIITTIEKVISHGHIELVETVAERIIEDYMQTDGVISMTVRVEKPDIINNTRSVGVEITRRT